MMNPSEDDQIKGKLHEVKGKLKEAIGQALGNPKLTVEGKVEKLSGNLQQKVGHIEEVLEK